MQEDKSKGNPNHAGILKASVPVMFNNTPLAMKVTQPSRKVKEQTLPSMKPEPRFRCILIIQRSRELGTDETFFYPFDVVNYSWDVMPLWLDKEIVLVI